MEIDNAELQSPALISDVEQARLALLEALALAEIA